jgi:hypothetical protein
MRRPKKWKWMRSSYKPVEKAAKKKIKKNHSCLSLSLTCLSGNFQYITLAGLSFYSFFILWQNLLGFWFHFNSFFFKFCFGKTKKK